MTNPKHVSWPAYFLAIAGGLAFAYLLGWIVKSIYPGASDDVVHRTAGGVLQLLGVGTMALGISQLRRMFGLENTVAEMISEWGVYLRKLWERIAQIFGKKRGVTVSVGSAHITAGAATMRAHGTVAPGPNASVDDRLRMLERQYAQLSKWVFEVEGKLQEEAKKHADALRAERQARESALGDLQRTLRALATGGIRLQLVGVIWFLAGISLATWAPEIAR